MNREQWQKKRDQAEARSMLTAFGADNVASLARPLATPVGSILATARHAGGMAATAWITTSIRTSVPRRAA